MHVPGVPRLAGPATRLRLWGVEDAPVLAAAWSDPAIRGRLEVPEPADEAAAVRWISQRERAWAEGRSVDLAVTDRQSGAVIGEVGLSGFDPARRAALIGWWIAEGWRGQGRAAEAVRLLLDWALSQGPLDAVMAEIDSGNPASAAVARRAGMRQVDVPGLESGGRAMLVFARTRTGAQRFSGD
ncbi:MAG: GNAT family N-acetyltransferase [Acidimicrobiaceae bacterium]|nr:GNAT family N-acetyltransferase [Acidimicrobiaceae bacterium]MYL05224.1 GNAT family N-acetyltransferase [Acidimicrobiaceae bacterium]